MLKNGFALKALLLPLGIIAAGVTTIVVLVAAKPKPQPRPAAPEPALMRLAVVEAQAATAHMQVTAQGVVRPRREIELVAQVAGQIVAVEPMFVDGGFFADGQLLIRIDDRDYRAALLASQARLAEAQQRFAEERGLSQQMRREWRDLGNADANDLFLRKPQLAAAQANVESAQAALAVAELQLERTRLTAPFQGRVRHTRVNLGQYVVPGNPLATLYDASIAEVRLPLTESQAALIDLPLTDTPQTPPPQVQLRGRVAGTPHQWSGVLARTDAFVDTQSRLYHAVVEVEDPFGLQQPVAERGPPLLPGLFVEADILGKPLANVWTLPRAALFERDKLLIVDAEQRVSVQRVHVYRVSENQVWVQAPWPHKTLVAVEKQTLASVGTQVEPVLSATQATAASNARGQ